MHKESIELMREKYKIYNKIKIRKKIKIYNKIMS